MENKAVQIIKTSESELNNFIIDLTSKENSKLIILDPHNNVDLVLHEEWASLEFTDLINSTDTSNDENALTAFLQARCATHNIETLPITEHSIRIGLKAIKDKFFEQNLYNDKHLYLHNKSDDLKLIAELLLQTILIIHSDKLKTEGREKRNSEKKIIIIFINYTNIMQEFISTIVTEARPSNLNLIFVSTKFSSFNYIRSSDLKHYLQ